MSSGYDGRAGTEVAQLRAFLTSPLFSVPWFSWQAWVLGTAHWRRQAKPGADSKTPSSTPGHLWRSVAFFAGGLGLFSFALAWLRLVLIHVPEPYLDEVFHIPQAQKYCEGRWLEWDDKITTPPGLYLFSVLYQNLWPTAVDGSSVWALRGANTIAILLVAMMACSSRAELESQQLSRQERRGDGKKEGQADGGTLSLYAVHTALNVAFFPVLFFFSALYYTDVYSTLVTLAAYRNHLFRLRWQKQQKQQKQKSCSSPPLWSGLATVILGLATLLMRQTNIFWVVVYMGGLEAVEAVKTLGPRTTKETEKTEINKFASPWALLWHGIGRASAGEIHDPPVGESWPDDWALSLASIGISALCHPVRVLLQVWPYVLVLGSFAGFVAWNGGVVLGDKSNHVATLHLAQLLYIWPLFAFFSAPLFFSHAVHYAQRGWQVLRTAGQKSAAAAGETAAPASSASSTSSTALMRLVSLVFVSKAYYPLYLASVLAAVMGIVRYNTIVHPFTLADNRHYMFYVFRYTIRRAEWIRYALVPVYIGTSWACWRVLWGGGGGRSSGESRETEKKSRDAGTGAGASFFGLLDEEPAGSASAAPVATSTALLWLLASALSLVTAPLVEPRYFILPWVFWRLLVPAYRPATKKPGQGSSSSCRLQGVAATLAGKLDGRLLLETAWFMAIHVGTMYIFLFRPYVWRAEDGNLLDEGRLQRFMW